MSNVEFPARTADFKDLPNGDRVWVQTLNSLLRDQADKFARRYAINECRHLLKGGSQYQSVLAEMQSMTIDGQAAYLAQGDFQKLREETLEKYPIPEEPEQGELTPEAFAALFNKWEADCKKADEKRQKLFDSRYEAELKRFKQLTVQVRLDRCCAAYFAREYTGVFTQRIVLEILYRATRLTDDHTQRYFPSVIHVEDCDDQIRETLIDFYFAGLDTVKQSDIPTLPDVS